MWDYLIITASNEGQAEGYQAQLDLRLKLGLLSDVRNVLVVADPGGKRIGSGGSTLICLMEVLQQKLSGNSLNSDILRKELGKLRILIIHAGGDSKRLPAYGPCGKIFVPVPGESDRCLPMTLFDRQLPTYLALPAPKTNTGQVVITSGDVMLRFDPLHVCFDQPGLTGLGCYASPQQAANHGVYCGVDEIGKVKRFLQKPTQKQQHDLGATDHYGRSVLDIGVMHFDADTAVKLLEIFGINYDENKFLKLSGKMGQAVLEHGLDFYREICCGLGSEATAGHYIQTTRNSGSKWDDVLLNNLLQDLGEIPFNLQLLDHCDFIDFGTSTQIIRSGTAMIQQDQPAAQHPSCLDINNELSKKGLINGSDCWIEGCRINAPLALGGRNVVTGVDINYPLSLGSNACLDVISGFDHDGQAVWFVRCYGVSDTFKDTIINGATFCDIPAEKWLKAMEANPDDIWDQATPEEDRTLWEARLFPAEPDSGHYHKWLWLYDPKTATPEQRANWKAARRYSLAEIVKLTNPENFFQRRLSIRSEQIKKNLRWFFRFNSELSAEELLCILENSEDQTGWITSLLCEAKWYDDSQKGKNTLAFSRMIHTLSTVLEKLSDSGKKSVASVFPSLAGQLNQAESDWLKSIELDINPGKTVDQWVRQARKLAFDSLSRTIILTGGDKPKHPVNRLRSDEIVWARAPARFDTGGGWTDTPPYSLEYGGCVVNAAVNLNGQAPIQAYLRITDKPVITIGSIDLGTRIKITDMDELMDYRSATSQYGLVKAALALSGFSHETAAWPHGSSLVNMLESFGGGIDITTLAAIPKGSGLGTSSIMGAVILAVIARAVGKEMTSRELFNKVLQLEQALTTGGGWQDQVGGVVGGVKIVYADPDLIPNPKIHYLPCDLLDPTANGGLTLLYYTGITRLAKNILEQVVGRYLDRNRRSMATLRKINDLAGNVAEALSRKDLPAFGQMIDTAWQLNKQIDPNSTNQQVEQLMERVSPYIYGAKLLGAGGGGFLLMVTKSPQDAKKLQQMLESDPPNKRARFFDYSINHKGLVVTVC